MHWLRDLIIKYEKYSSQRFVVLVVGHYVAVFSALFFLLAISSVVLTPGYAFFRLATVARAF